MPSFPHQNSTAFGAASSRDWEEAAVSFFFASLFGGPAGLACGGGLLGALACVGAASFLHRRYQRLMRKGYYGYERRREEARKSFEAATAGLKDDPARQVENYKRALSDYFAALDRIDADFEREAGAGAGRRGREAPWASPRAQAARLSRRKARNALWRDWARESVEAARRGRAPRPSPAERRVGGGAPIRRLCERSSSPPPSPEALLAQYERAKGRGRVEEKLRLGSMLLDIEATADSSLVRDESGEIVGRNAGVRGWLAERCPALLPHYASLMAFRRLSDEFRKAHGLRDPHPATRFLEPAFPADAFAPVLRKAMRDNFVAARTLLDSPAAKTAKGFAEALARERRRGIVPRRRVG